MARIRSQPLRELATLQRDVNDLVECLWAGGGTGRTGEATLWSPALDAHETDDAVVLRLDLPGLDRDDVAIEVDGDQLTIIGERSVETTDGERPRRRERMFGQFSRSVTLLRGIKADAIEAAYADGVLTVGVPKPEESKPKRIGIAGGDVIEGSGRETA